MFAAVAGSAAVIGSAGSAGGIFALWRWAVADSRRSAREAAQWRDECRRRAAAPGYVPAPGIRIVH